MSMFMHIFCLCPLSLTITLNFNISKVAYCVQLKMGHAGKNGTLLKKWVRPGEKGPFAKICHTAKNKSHWKAGSRYENGSHFEKLGHTETWVTLGKMGHI